MTDTVRKTVHKMPTVYEVQETAKAGDYPKAKELAQKRIDALEDALNDALDMYRTVIQWEIEHS